MNDLYNGGSLAGIIIGAIERFPDRPALADDDNQWTYRELGDVIRRMITVYVEAGVQSQEGVAVLTANRVHALAAIWAALIMGLRYVPLHPMASEDEQLFVLLDSEAKVLVVDAANFAERGEKLRVRRGDGVIAFSLGPLPDMIDICARANVAEPAPLKDCSVPTDIAWLMYTGGTTGRSKGVMLSHRAMAVVALVQFADWDWPKNIRFLAVTPISHAAGALLYPVLYRGGFARLLNGFDTVRFCSAVEKDSINACFLVPTLIGKLVEASEIRARHDMSSLEMIGYGAAPISAALLARALGTFGRIFVQLYGQSEAPQCVMTMRQDDHDDSIAGRLESCGRPTPLNQVKLFDAEMNEVPDGQPGELCIRGPFVMDGYWRQPDLTEEVFRGGWLHTGDVAVKGEDGFYFIVDRVKDMIISGGFNIYPREVEEALESCPQVAGAAVIGIPDEKWGEAVAAFIVTEDGAPIDPEVLKALVKTRRGAAWVPKSFSFIAELPLTSLGKVDRKSLRAPFWTDRSRGVA